MNDTSQPTGQQLTGQHTPSSWPTEVNVDISGVLMSNGSGPVNNYAVTSNNCGPSAISDIIREPSVLSFKVAVNGEQSPWLYGHRKFERIANFVSRHVCSERPTEFTIYWKTALISRINNVRFTVSNRHRLTSVDCLAAAIVDAVGDDCDVLLNDNGVLVVTDDRRVRVNAANLSSFTAYEMSLTMKKITINTVGL